MHYLILLMIVAVSFVDQLSAHHLLPRALQFLPEFLSGIVVLYVVALGARQRFQYVRAPYWLAFSAVLAVILCGAIANSVAPGPLFAGIRYYTRALPLFLLPAVYEFKDSQIRQQLRLLLLVAIVQLPFAAYQRWIVMRAEKFSGDSVVGTLLDSSVLSIYLIGAVCILTGLFLHQRISKLTYFALFFYLLAATTINETKGTLILLPIGLLAAVLVGAPPAKRIRIFLLTVSLFAVFLAGFVPIYDYVEQKGNPYYVSIEKFFTDEKKVDRYLDNHSRVGAQKQAGRLNAVLVPLKSLARDPVQLAFGVGVGNASRSSLGPQFTGAYFPLYEGFLVSSFSVFLLEIGVFGTVLVFVLYWLIFRDAVVLARTDDTLTGWLAVGWTGITLFVVVATPYKTMHAYESLSYLFWYFSGVVAARRMRVAAEILRTRSIAPPLEARRAAVVHATAAHSSSALQRTL